MASYSVGQAADLLGISVDSVRRLTDSKELLSKRSSSGRRVIDGKALAAFAKSRQTTLTVERATPQSARNCFPGIVTKVVTDKVMAQVEVKSGPFRVVSLISREAVDELGLVVGSAVNATVKATNVVIEASKPSPTESSA